MISRLIRKNLFIKSAILIVVLNGILSGGYYILYRIKFLQNITPLYFAIILLDIAIIYIVLFYISISLPFSVILDQIKSLLTGRRYNKLFTERIDEIGVVAHFFNEMTKSLENVSKDIQEKRRMSEELGIAARIQKSILPDHIPSFKDLTFIAKSKPAAEIGGDTFDFTKNGDNTFFFIGDSTGHGTPAGLVMMMVHTLLMTFSNMYNTGYEVIYNTNKYLKPLLNSIMFMTLTLFRFNHIERKLYWVGAGHLHIIVYKSSQKKCIIEKSGGIALGMIADNSKLIKEQNLDFEPNDMLVVYSDGVTEAKNIYGELFGLNHLVELIEQNAGKKTMEDILDIITTEIAEFAENHIQEDDMSIILCKFGQELGMSTDTRSIVWDVKSSRL